MPTAYQSHERVQRGSRRRPRAVGLLLLIATLLFAMAAAADATDPTTDGTTTSPDVTTRAPEVTTQNLGPPKPTIVLVPGAWVDSSSWDGVVSRLQADGYTVEVWPNPLRGLASDAAYLEGFLRSISGTVVLAGQSYGGAVITNAATSLHNVSALVYIDAVAPARGESVLQLAAARPGSAISGATDNVFNLVLYPGASHGDVDLYVKPEVFARALANDLSKSRAAVLASTQRPVTLSALKARSGAPAWRTIPSWYLVGTADHIIPPAEQLFMASGRMPTSRRSRPQICRLFLGLRQ